MAEVRTGTAGGRRRVTDCPVQGHTRQEQGLTGTQQDGMVGPASPWQPMTTVFSHARDTGLGTQKPSSALAPQDSRGPQNALLLKQPSGWLQTHCVAGDDLQRLILP